MDYGSYSPSPRRDSRHRRRRRARRRLLLLVIAVIVVAAVVVAVALSRGAGENDVSGQGKQASGESAAKPTPKATPTTPPPKVWVASKAEPVRVWVGGDSMGGELGWGLGPMLTETNVLQPILYYKESSGICRWDFFHWGDKMESVMQSAKPDAVAIMMGTNDTQSVSLDGGDWIAYGTSAWKTAYARRVGKMMDTMFEGGARRVYWVGMPIMGEGWRNSRMKIINTIIEKQAAAHPGAKYIDVWPLFTTGDGAYDSRWRGGDGVHFTVAGQERLSKVVFAAIKKDWAPDGFATPTPSPSASPSASPVL